MIAAAEGPSGANREYLDKLVRSVRDLELGTDTYLEALPWHVHEADTYIQGLI